MDRRDKVYTYALAILIGIMIALVLLALTNYPAYAEEEIQPRIVYTRYDGCTLYGIAEVPDGEYYARITFYLEDNVCFWVFCPIDEYGGFCMYVLAPCRYISGVVADSNLMPCIMDDCAEWLIYEKGE